MIFSERPYAVFFCFENKKGGGITPLLLFRDEELYQVPAMLQLQTSSTYFPLNSIWP